MLTIFTPAYNRECTLNKLYKSLCRQTIKDFEWLIVDDGSIDNTKCLVADFIEENLINIRYVYQDNGGKHTAINRGVALATGDIFMIVDSDDYLADNAVERIFYHYSNIAENKEFAGVSGLRAYPNGNKIGGEEDWSIIDESALDIRCRCNVNGDLSEVYKTSILKEYPFVVVPNEKLCPEALVWNRIAQKYKLRYFYEKIYICEYLEGGLTANIVKLRMNSPVTSMLYYAELKSYQIPFSLKIKAAINYWRFAFCCKKGMFENLSTIGVETILLIPFGYLMHLKDIKQK